MQKTAHKKRILCKNVIVETVSLKTVFDLSCVFEIKKNYRQNEDQIAVRRLFGIHCHGQEIFLFHVALDSVGDQKTWNERKGMSITMHLFNDQDQ